MPKNYVTHIPNMVNQDDKKCFESRDYHFICLDKQKDKMDHSYCKKTYLDWREDCHGRERKFHMINRFLDQKNKRLYTKREILEINKQE